MHQTTNMGLIRWIVYCGGVLGLAAIVNGQNETHVATGSPNFFYSPEYLTKIVYDNDLKYDYRVVGNGSSRGIKLTVVACEIEYLQILSHSPDPYLRMGQNGTCMDYLEIYDGFDDNAPPINDKLCCYNVDLPLNYVTTSNVAYLRFNTDHYVGKRGFIIEYSADIETTVELNTTDIDECLSHPCQNGAACVNGQNQYTCTCTGGWQGTNCDIDIDECLSLPCQNGGTCVNGHNQYICICTGGWLGTNCDIDIDECLSLPCQNGGTCVNGQNQYTCICTGGWLGTDCDIDIDECLTHPCQNGAACVNGQNQYTCTCTGGWQGTNCDIGTGVENAITVDCDKDGWDISVDMADLRQFMYPDAKPSDFYLGDQNCTGNELNDTLHFLLPMRGCSTRETIRNDTLTYTNDLVYAVHDVDYPSIIRDISWTVTVECDVPRRGFALGQVLHNSAKQSVLPVVATTGQYPVNMSFSLERNFTQPLSGTPIHVPVGVDVYVIVYTTVYDDEIKMNLVNCSTRTGSSTSQNMTHALIIDGCAVDTGTRMISYSLHDTVFVFKNFQYIDNLVGMEVMCYVVFCSASDYTHQCTQSCTPVVRRSVPE